MDKTLVGLGVVSVGAIALIALLVVPALMGASTVGGKIGVQFYNEDGTPIVSSFWDRFLGLSFIREGTPIASNFDGTVTITVTYTSGIDAAKGITVATALKVTCRLQSQTGGIVSIDTSKSWTTSHGDQEPLIQSVKGSYDLLMLTNALSDPNPDGWSIILEATLTATGQNTEGQTITATGTASFTFTVKYSSGTITVSAVVSA